MTSEHSNATGTARTQIGTDSRDIVLTMAVGWAAYAAFRVVQTMLWGRVEPIEGMRNIHRVILSVADGMLMVAMTPLAVWATRRFPIDRHRVRHIAMHVIFGVGWSMAGMAALRWAGELVTGTADTTPFFDRFLNWVTLNLFAYFIAVAISHAMFGAQRARADRLRASELEAQLSTARLEALKTQLEPHFLFNTLHAVSELVHSNPDAADATLMKLGELLRRTLDTSPSQTVTVDDELRYVGAYLDIHRVRHGERLGVRYDIAHGAESAHIPSMILQPLVENAVRHGIARSQNGGTITISARRTSDRLVLTVSDDGAGVVHPIVEGVGLTNTRRRLQVLYGANQSVDLAANSPRGARVTVSIPAVPTR